MKKLINYAHRGASSYAPENTIKAFELALEMKANGIELDLRQTKDGKIVIFHDDTIDNKSNGKGCIKDYTYAELLSLDFGSWFSQEYKDEKIVLFEDFIKLYFDKNITFAIELKEVGFEDKVIDILKIYNILDKVYISSFIFEALENIRRIDKNIKISWLINEEITNDNINKLLKIRGNEICPKATIVSEKQTKIANDKGLNVRLWGVKNEKVMRRVYQLNISGMTVNFPDKLNELIKH